MENCFIFGILRQHAKKVLMPSTISVIFDYEKSLDLVISLCCSIVTYIRVSEIMLEIVVLDDNVPLLLSTGYRN